jgi:hypothetical protein
VKAGCGKTARPVWAADGGQREERASSDPTPKKPVNAGGGTGPWFGHASERGGDTGLT